MEDSIYIVISILFFLGLIAYSVYQHKKKIIHTIEHLAWKTTSDSEYALI